MSNINFERNKKELVIFDRKHCKKLLTNEKIEEAKRYLDYFFFPFENKIFFFNGREFVLYNRDDAIKLIPDDFKISIVVANEHTKKFEKEEISLKAYLKSTDFMDLEYKPTIEFKSNDLIISKERRIRGFTFTEKYLNMAKPFNFDVIKGLPIEQTAELQENMRLIYHHIENILCSNHKESYVFLLNFFSCTVAGRKLRKAIILQSKERTGKGMILNDILKAILGDRMHKTNSVESILQYSKPFEGCCCLNFDELPHCDNYKGLQDMLKALITEPFFNCRDMYSRGYQQQNTFNILITTNNDAVSLTQNNNTKYVCLDINEEKIGDHKYFERLKKAIEGKDVLEQFYNDMMERFKTLDNWNEDYMPTTQTTKVKIIEALPKLYKDLKEVYILTNTDLNIRTDDFFIEYAIRTKDRTSKNKLGRMLKDIGILPKKNSNNNGYNYKITSKELYKEYQSKNWIDELVDVMDNVDYDEPVKEIKESKKEKKVKEIKESEKELLKELDEIDEVKIIERPKKEKKRKDEIITGPKDEIITESKDEYNQLSAEEREHNKKIMDKLDEVEIDIDNLGF
jgi:hypothetical protein